ncbi:unnamed protein product [Phaeothamnion confervicola]
MALGRTNACVFQGLIRSRFSKDQSPFLILRCGLLFLLNLNVVRASPLTANPLQQALFGLNPGATILIDFDNADKRLFRAPPAPPDGRGVKHADQLLIFQGNEPVSGTATVLVAPGKRVEHLGIKVELIGQIELFYDRGSSYDFTSQVRELDSAGVLTGTRAYRFDFSAAEKPYESYTGMNVRLRYLVRVTVSRNYGNISREHEFIVQNLQAEPEANPPLKMEVGIEECLHIEFEYDKSKYHLQDAVIGKIYFLLVRIKIKHMELAVIRRETAGSGANVANESETVVKYEVMDGAPVKGECTPLRLFLRPYDSLTPTYRNVNNKFSVKYYLNLVLVDEEDRRYFKQQARICPEFILDFLFFWDRKSQNGMQKRKRKTKERREGRWMDGRGGIEGRRANAKESKVEGESGREGRNG